MVNEAVDKNAHPQNLRAAGCSSSYIKTTTTPKGKQLKNWNEPLPSESLVYPARLDANRRAIVARYLMTIPADQRQSVLDELEGRIQAEKQGAKPVYDEVRYLHQLCREANRRGFQLNLGLKVQSERERNAHKRPQAPAANRGAQRSPEQPRTRAVAERALGEIRKSLGISTLPGTKI